ncbi:LacI family DNA-binding transcriptional regulator [Massilia sp. TN1-12]|uniref:LacI family DNA-binding transcriptional regulator n=1 Tax=Massilia paldalensis TaxID=3377675 RepID=UPI00384FBD46
MATMKQVAQQAGVSISTVSHVINNTRVVSDEVRQRVLGVIAELRYIPSAVARSLKNDRTGMIGVLVPDSSNPYFAELIRWIEEAAFEAGYNIILCNARGGAAKQAAYLRLLMEKRIDGLLLVASSADCERELLMRAGSVPVIQLERALPGLDADAILAGEPGGAVQAAHHLLELGHRDIACVAGPADLPRTIERMTGFLRTMEEAGLPVPPQRIVHAEFTSAGGYAAFNRLLTSDRPPSAIFATSDLMAFGGLWAAREAGVRVPEQLSVMGFDDLDGVGYTSPPLTTVAPPKREMARLALAWLVERIGGSQAPLRHTALESHLVLRATCAPPR